MEPQGHQDRVWGTAREPGQGKRDNPGCKAILLEDFEHFLEAGLPARALGGSFETVRKTQQLHATVIPGQAQRPLRFAVTP